MQYQQYDQMPSVILSNSDGKTRLAIQSFLAFTEEEAFIDALHQSCAEMTRQAVTDLLEVYRNEACFGWERVKTHLEKLSADDTMLEVGAGGFLLTIYLAYCQYKIEAIEPVGEGFSFMSPLRQLVLAHAEEMGLHITWYDSKAEALSAQAHGKYDFIFCINVLEHIDNPQIALQQMIKCLTDNGKLFIHCPNYIVPYEPHYSLIMVPFSPALTRRLYATRIEQDESVWNSLNFITYTRLKRMVKSLGFNILPQENLLYLSVRRMGEDPVFARRLPNAIRRAIELLKRMGLIRLLKHVPPALQSPMEVVIHR